MIYKKYGPIILGSLILVSCNSKIKQAGSVPNFIIILADDMGYGDPGCYGNTWIKTPNIDLLAEEGIRFTDFHSNGSTCTPTRVALLTGRYQQRAGLENAIQVSDEEIRLKNGLAAEEITFAEVLKDAGYRTAVVGKWHVGEREESHPLNQGFDEFIGFMTNPDYFSHSSRLGEHDWFHGYNQTREEGYITELISKHSIEFLKRNKNNPFCLYVSHKAPHGPLQGPTDTAIWHENKIIRPLPRTSRPGEDSAVFKEMVESLDYSIGELLIALKETNIEKNTIIFFFSDNGPVGIVNTAGLRGRKGQLYEGGHRVPGIVRWPAEVEAGGICDETVMGMDIFPTFLELAGIHYESEEGRKLDGTSFLPLLKGDNMPNRTLFWRSNGGIAVRNGDWKLVRQKEAEKSENKFMLFNLKNDPGESNDLSLLHPEMVQKLISKINNWESDVDSSIP